MAPQTQQDLQKHAPIYRIVFICLVCGVFVLCVMMFSRIFCCPAYADTTTQTTANAKTITRYAGEDRYDTSNLINAALAKMKTYDGVIVCSARDGAFADALCAAALSGLLDYPIVLTNGSLNALDADTANTVSDLFGGSKGDVIVLGGTATVSAGVRDGLSAYDSTGSATRISGDDRYATADAIYTYGAKHGRGWPCDYAIVVQGNNFPDALCAASFCSEKASPMLLTDSTTTSLEPYVASAAQVVGNIIIVGGTTSVSAEKERALESYANVQRFGGDTRYTTNLSFVEWELGCGMHLNSIGVASGQSFPDALGSSSFLASSASVLFLASQTEAVNDALYAFISANKTDIETVNIFGGRASVTGRTKAAIREQLCDEQSDAPWYADNKLICHAMGMIDGHTYLNCKEAMELNYDLGFRVFECDLSLTSDAGLVGVHDWEGWKNTLVEGQFDGTIPTKEEFLSLKMYGQYTGLCIEDIFLFMEDHPDFWLVTDTKETDPELYREQFQVMEIAAEKLGCTDVLDRVIVQMYCSYMYDDIYEIYPFQNWIYTLYLEDFAGQPDKLAEFADFCNEYDIAVITMWNYLCSDEIIRIAKDYDVQLFVHTVNDEQAKEEFLANNVGVYTDIY